MSLFFYKYIPINYKEWNVEAEAKVFSLWLQLFQWINYCLMGGISYIYYRHAFVASVTIILYSFTL